MTTTAPLIAALIALAGCETTSETLDRAETQVRETRVAYQERMDRVSADWICSGMSWQSLARFTRGDQQFIDAIVDACRARAGIPELSDP